MTAFSNVTIDVSGASPGEPSSDTVRIRKLAVKLRAARAQVVADVADDSLADSFVETAALAPVAAKLRAARRVVAQDPAESSPFVDTAAIQSINHKLQVRVVAKVSDDTFADSFVETGHFRAAIDELQRAEAGVVADVPKDTFADSFVETGALLANYVRAAGPGETPPDKSPEDSGDSFGKTSAFMAIGAKLKELRKQNQVVIDVPGASPDESGLDTVLPGTLSAKLRRARGQVVIDVPAATPEDSRSQTTRIQAELQASESATFDVPGLGPGDDSEEPVWTGPFEAPAWLTADKPADAAFLEETIRFEDWIVEIEQRAGRGRFFHVLKGLHALMDEPGYEPAPAPRQLPEWRRKLGSKSSKTRGSASSQAVGRSSSQAVGRSSSQAVGRSSSQAVGRSSSQAVGRSSSQAVNRSDAETIGISSSEVPADDRSNMETMAVVCGGEPEAREEYENFRASQRLMRASDSKRSRVLPRDRSKWVVTLVIAGMTVALGIALTPYAKRLRATMRAEQPAAANAGESKDLATEARLIERAEVAALRFRTDVKRSKPTTLTEAQIVEVERLRELTEQGAPKVKDLISLLAESSGPVEPFARAAVAHLTTKHPSLVLSKLRARLTETPGPLKRAKIARALSVTGAAGVRSLASIAVSPEESEPVRLAAIAGLARSGAAGAIGPLSTLTTHKDPGLRAAAIDGLAELCPLVDSDPVVARRGIDPRARPGRLDGHPGLPHCAGKGALRGGDAPGLEPRSTRDARACRGAERQRRQPSPPRGPDAG
jgi:hypothetical protein